MALYHIFKKNGFLLVVLLICFFGIKFFTVCSLTDVKEQNLLDEWVTECSRYNYEQVCEYINSIGSNILINENLDRTVLNQYAKLNTSFRNYKNVNNLISFANLHKGELPIRLPYNYMKQLDFYQNLKFPRLLNEGGLNNYFELQKYNIVPFITIIIISFFGGLYYETDMYKCVLTTKKGRKYNNITKLTTISICLIFLILNELFDLLYSGLFSDNIVLNASLQSYSYFSNTQMNITICGCLFFIFFSKIISLFILGEITYFISSICRNTRDALIASFSMLLTSFLFGQALSETHHYSLLQFGIVDWKIAIKNTVIFSSLGTNTLLLGSVLLFLIFLFINLIALSFISKSRRNKNIS